MKRPFEMIVQPFIAIATNVIKYLISITLIQMQTVPNISCSWLWTFSSPFEKLISIKFKNHILKMSKYRPSSLAY